MTRPSFIIVMFVLLAAGSDLLAQERVGSHSEGKKNICLGGLDDGKLIPHDGNIDNHFRQTSELGCAIDGGVPAFLPDLAPLIPDGKLV